jgi:PAS domain S-box-containing protein
MAGKQSNSGRRSGMHQTTLRFGPALWAELEEAARVGGTSIAQFVREAAVARLAYTAGRQGDPGLERALEVARDAASYDELETRVGDLVSNNEALDEANVELQALGIRGRERASDLDQLAVMLESALSSAGVAVIVLDATGRINAWNSASERILGLSAKDARGRSFVALDLPVLTPAVHETVALALAPEPRSSAGALVSDGRALPLRALPLSADHAVGGAVVLIGEPSADGDAGTSERPAT